MLSKLLHLLRLSLPGSLLLLAAASSPAQTTLHVGPGQTYSTIQSANKGANKGDTVLVAPGTYNENIDFKGKAITVTTSGGASKTTIDGGNKPGVPTVVFGTAETRDSVISGFTIRGGGDLIGGASNGGIFVSAASPTIQNNTITANYCHNIDVEGGAALILNNEISDLLATGQGTYCVLRGAIYLGPSSIFIDGLSSSIIGNTIENNLTGSAINLYGSEHTLILNNTIRNNTSPDAGSALEEAGAIGTAVVQNLIYNNISTCGGAIGFNEAGLVNNLPTILIANNTLVDNIYLPQTNGSNCTPIAQIYPSPDSYGQSGPGAVIENNIVSGNTIYPAVNCSSLDPPSESIQPLFQNNILRNISAPFFGNRCIDVSQEYNNTSADPLFTNPTSRDYHLKAGSPAIDAGLNQVFTTYQALTGLSLTTDFDGKPRPQDTTGIGCNIDMGIYEYPGTTSDCGRSETLSSSLNPAPAAAAVTFTVTITVASGSPAGTVKLLDGTTPLTTLTIAASGIATYTTTTLAVGKHTITANYTSADAATADTASLVETITSQATTTLDTRSTLTATPTTATHGAPVQLKATVAPATPSGKGTPTGTVTFLNGTTQLASSPLTNGLATLSITTLPAGVNTVTCTYSGDTIYNASTCNAVPVTIVALSIPGDFSITTTPTSATLYTGQSTSTTITLTPLNGFNQPVYLNCASLPANTTCTFNTPSIQPGQGSTKLVIATTAPQKSAGLATTSGLLIAILSLASLRKRRTLLARLSLVILAITAALTATGCRAPTPIANGTPPGIHPIPITATSADGAITHTATFTLTVKSLF